MTAYHTSNERAVLSLCLLCEIYQIESALIGRFWFRNLLNIGKDFNYGTAFAQSPEIMNCTLPIRFIGEYYVIRR